MKVAVLGSGPGALAVAADMSRHGRATTLVGFDDFGSNLEPVAANGGVTVTFADGIPATHPVTVAGSIPEAIDGADLIVAVVPCSAHDRLVDAIAPHVTAEQTVLFLGEGSGAIVARRAIDQPTVIAEASTLPYLARSTGPGSVTAFRKLGGVLIATLPATPADTAHTTELIADVWPYATATDTVWNTVLANYDAIVHVAAMIANAGTLQNHTGGMLLWGEGATPAVVNVIETVDNELLALRRALNSKESRRYQDFLVAQGLAPDLGPGATLFDTVRASKPVMSYASTGDAGQRPDRDAGQPTGDAGQRLGRDAGQRLGGDGGPDTRDVTEDVPYALVLASSLGDATGVPTPAVDGVVDSASSMLGRDFRAEGRTLATLGLDGLDTTGLIGFARTGVFP